MLIQLTFIYVFSYFFFQWFWRIYFDFQVIKSIYSFWRFILFILDTWSNFFYFVLEIKGPRFPEAELVTSLEIETDLQSEFDEDALPLLIRTFEGNPNITETDGFSICSWLHPHRYRQTNDIFHVLVQNSTNISVIKLTCKFLP